MKVVMIVRRMMTFIYGKRILRHLTHKVQQQQQVHKLFKSISLDVRSQDVYFNILFLWSI